MQTERLFSILLILLQTGGMTAADLAKRLSVSVRTIYRDLDALSLAGIPLYTIKGPGGGVRLLPEFVLDRLLLSEKEQREILFALKSMEDTGATPVQGLADRLAGIFKQKNVDWLTVDLTNWGSSSKDADRFQLLKGSILERRTVAFDYYSAYGQKTRRKVEPLRLWFKGGSWYLQGFCLEKQSIRIFKLNRMGQLEQLGSSFSPRAIPPPEDRFELSPQRQEVGLTLRFAPEASFRVLDEFSQDQIHPMPDGSYTVEVCYPMDGWVYGFLLSFGPQVQVLAPHWMREKMRELAKNIFHLYENN